MMSTKNERIRDVLADENPEAICYDGMDEALIGIYRGDLARQNMQERSIAVYSYVKFIEVYIKRDGMSEEEARKRISSQMCRTERLERSDYVIENSGDMAALGSAINELWVRRVKV